MLGNFRFFHYMGLLSLVLFISACDTNTSNNSIDNPNPEIFKPVGSVVGVLTDKVTGEPIAGAVIDVGLATAVTNSNGVYVLHNLPATADATGSSTLAGTYTAIVNLQNVTSPINMIDAAVSPRYPSHSVPTTITVNYTTLEDSSLVNDASANPSNDTLAANHDTPVSGLVGSKDIAIAKLSASVTGAIHMQSDNSAVAETYTVELWIDKNSDTTFTNKAPTGSTGDDYVFNRFSTLDTAFQNFNFSNVPAGSTAYIIGMNATGSSVAYSGIFTTPGDQRTIDFTGIQNAVLLASSSDAVAPYVVSTSPEHNATVDSAVALTVTINFSEALLGNSFALGVSPDTTGASDRVSDILTVAGKDVSGTNFTPAYTISWATLTAGSNDYTKLQVNMAALAEGATYTVTLASTALTTDLVDAAGNALPATPLTVGGVASNNFSFNTSSPSASIPAAPTATVLASSTLNAVAGANVKLDWAAVANATNYNVYRTTLIEGVPTIVQDLIKKGTSGVTAYTDNTANLFSDGNGNGVKYNYYVSATNVVGSESALSAAVAAADTTAPTIVSVAGCSATALTVNFSEPMDADFVETATNYTSSEAGATISAAVQNSVTQVALTATGLTCGTPSTLTVNTAITDANGVAITANTISY